ncbi:hypothetical protein FGO68_gene14939 [Halteria grandinella]|uniref:TRAF-type domain-containing protein n=1 Tax=Halteria grandinella TaxID=5974 RepID=A0A8J8P6A6_HALGN|nr:hypothetical protein FGO68_gene14939 [Halteria grandinella]
MKEHLEYCPLKPLQCPYCELKIPQLNEGYTKHISYCESKTRLCDDCCKQIQQKFFEPHILNGECMLNQAEKREKEVRMNKLYFEKFKNEQVLRAKEIKEQKAAVQTTLTKPNQQIKEPSPRKEKSYKEKVLGKNKVQVQLDESDETPNTKRRAGQEKSVHQGNSQRIKEQIQEESQKKRLSKQQDREKKAAVKRFF